MSAVRRTSSTKLSGKAMASVAFQRGGRGERTERTQRTKWSFLQFNDGDAAAAFGTEANVRHVRMPLEKIAHGPPQLPFAEAVDHADLVPVREQRLVERLVHAGQRLVHGQAHEVHLGRAGSG